MMIFLALASLTTPIIGDQSTLDRFSLKCGLSAGDVTYNPASKLVRIIPQKPLSPGFEQIKCLLPKLKKAGYRTKVGFISEPPRAPEKN